MIFEDLKLGIEVTDAEFDDIYPKDIRPLSKRHFSPVAIAKMAAEYLADTPNTKVLDIGSGVGKFCMIGAACTEGVFTGVEQRENLYDLAVSLAQKYDLPNAHFIHGNILSINFKDYDAFYFFNAFFENILVDDSIDDTVELDKDLFFLYSLYLKRQLSKLPIGTKLATYYACSEEIPPSYTVVSTQLEGRFKLWEKTEE
jgi:SAM-dependent methyltransferase